MHLSVTISLLWASSDSMSCSCAFLSMLCLYHKLPLSYSPTTLHPPSTRPSIVTATSTTRACHPSHRFSSIHSHTLQHILPHIALHYHICIHPYPPHFSHRTHSPLSVHLYPTQPSLLTADPPYPHSDYRFVTYHSLSFHGHFTHIVTCTHVDTARPPYAHPSLLPARLPYSHDPDPLCLASRTATWPSSVKSALQVPSPVPPGRLPLSPSTRTCPSDVTWKW